MADFVSIDWDLNQLRVATAKVTRGKVEFGKAFRLPWPTELESAPPSRVGEWLASMLKEQGVEAEQGVVSLPRDGVVFRPLELPNVGDDDLPDLVRLQAETRSTVPLERLAMDFLPLPKLGETRTVLLVTAAAERVNAIRSTFQAANIELEAVGLSMIATGELLLRSTKHHGVLEGAEPVVVVIRAASRVELGVYWNGALAYSHSVQLGGEDEASDRQYLVTELRRAMMGADKLLQGRKAARFLLLDSSSAVAELGAFLAEKLSLPFEPLCWNDIRPAGATTEEDDACFSGAYGMLLSRSGAKMPGIDLINPRKARPRVDIRKRRMKMAGGIGGLLLLVFFVWSRWMLSNMDDTLADLRSRKQVIDAALKVDAPELKAHEVIDDWARRDVSMLDQTGNLKRALPGTDRIYLSDLNVSVAPGDELFRIQAKGNAVDRSDVEALYQQLADFQYRVRGSEIPRTSRDAKYPFKMQLDVSVVKRTNGVAPSENGVK